MNREPIFGRNAKAFAIQFAFVIIFLVLFAGPVRNGIGSLLCDGLSFCSSAQEQQRAIERRLSLSPQQ